MKFHIPSLQISSKENLKKWKKERIGCNELGLCSQIKHFYTHLALDPSLRL